MELVLVESPYAGNVALNLDYLKTAMRDCFRRGEAPFASHMLYTQVLDDEKPDERTQGIEAGLAWGAMATKTVVYTDLGISTGMHFGIQRAHKEGRPVERRSIQPWLGNEAEASEIQHQEALKAQTREEVDVWLTEVFARGCSYDDGDESMLRLEAGIAGSNDHHNIFAVHVERRFRSANYG